MEKIILTIDRISELISRAGVLLSALAIFAMTVVITINVVLRKTMDYSFLFVEEYSGYLIVLIVYFGLAWALRSEKHIHMELVVRQLSPRVRRGVELVNTVICLGLLGYFLVEGTKFALFSLELGIRSEWYSGSIMWPFHSLIPIGLAMFTLEMIGYFARIIRTKP